MKFINLKLRSILYHMYLQYACSYYYEHICSCSGIPPDHEIGLVGCGIQMEAVATW